MIFGRLTVIEAVGNRGARVRCQCACGNIKIVSLLNLHRGHTKSCGCLRRENSSKRALAGIFRRETHGQCYTKTYSSWNAMKDRCRNPNNPEYHHYGGRGITVCDRWLKFESFLEDMGPRPRGTSIDRIDNNGGYCKENCQWLSYALQNSNKRTNRFVEYKGKMVPLAHVAKDRGIPYPRLWYRINNGWSLEDAINTPGREW